MFLRQPRVVERDHPRCGDNVRLIAATSHSLGYSPSDRRLRDLEDVFHNLESRYVWETMTIKEAPQLIAGPNQCRFGNLPIFTLRVWEKSFPQELNYEHMANLFNDVPLQR